MRHALTVTHATVRTPHVCLRSVRRAHHAVERVWSSAACCPSSSRGSVQVQPHWRTGRQSAVVRTQLSCRAADSQQPSASATASAAEGIPRLPPQPAGTDRNAGSTTANGAIRGLLPDNPLAAVITYAGVGTTAGALGYVLHAPLLDACSRVLALQPLGEDSTFETNFFGLLAILYAILTGSTFTFLYERLANIIHFLYQEVYALELLVQHSLRVIRDQNGRQQLLNTIRRYVDLELYNPEDLVSPFDETSPLLTLMAQLQALPPTGAHGERLLRMVEKLAEAQNMRSAVAAQILPAAHWVFLTIVGVVVLLSFLVFEGSSEVVTHERQVIFALLCSLLCIMGVMLADLSDPLDGLYTYHGVLTTRVSCLLTTLDRLEAGGPAAGLGSGMGAILGISGGGAPAGSGSAEGGIEVALEVTSVNRDAAR